MSKDTKDDMNEINNMRKLLGMKLLKKEKPLTRNCLNCNKKFVSEGNHNRVCSSYCKSYTGI